MRLIIHIVCQVDRAIIHIIYTYTIYSIYTTIIMSIQKNKKNKKEPIIWFFFIGFSKYIFHNINIIRISFFV